MLVIGLIREGKVPADNRVALVPAQCKWLVKHFPDIRILVQTSPNRCFTDDEYTGRDRSKWKISAAAIFIGDQRNTG
jgi:alanine dehydrogenase